MRSFATRALFAAVCGAMLVATSNVAAAPHTFDLADKMPDRLAIMFAVNWFGVSKSDPQGPGSDPGYGNWQHEEPDCGLTNNPATCADFPDAGKQRDIASKRRPLAGIYSSSGRDAESKRRIDLMLSNIRRPCDDGARLDAFGIQLDSIKFTSAYPANKQSATWDIAYRALLGFYERADAAGLNGAVAAAIDSTVYWHFGSDFGLTTQDARKAALTDDLVDTVKLAYAHPSATTIAGKPLILFYTDRALITPDEWSTMLDDARTRTGKDFYALDTDLHADLFAAFDALAPWMNLGVWDSSTGATLKDRAMDWQEKELGPLIAAAASTTYPKRVVFGSATPGFDDYTQNWGTCTPREIPRDPQVLDGVMAANKAHGLKGIIAETWDDWTEGHEFEPDVVGGTEKLVLLRQLLGVQFGDPVDPAGDKRLDDRWKAFGQPRSCCFVDGSCSDAGAPAVDLSCADAGTDAPLVDAPSSDAPHADGTTDATGDAVANPDAPSDAPGSAPSDSSGGCGCRTSGEGRASFGSSALVALIGLSLRSRRAIRRSPRRENKR